MIAELRIQNLRDEMRKYHDLVERFDKKFREDYNFPEREKEEVIIDEECEKISQRVADMTKEFFIDMQRAGIYIRDVSYDYEREENSVYFQTMTMRAAKVFKVYE
jgi:hypothetical protein